MMSKLPTPAEGSSEPSEPPLDAVERKWKSSDECATVRLYRTLVWAGVVIGAVLSIAVAIFMYAAQAQNLRAISDEISDTAYSLSSARQALEQKRQTISSTTAPPSPAVIQILSDLAKADQKSIEELQRRRDELSPQNISIYDLRDRWLGYGALQITIILLVVVAAKIFLTYLCAEKRRQYDNKRLVKKISDESPDDPFDFKRLWIANKAQLSDYHQLVQNYAQSTRQSTQIFLSVGFVFIIVVGIFALTRSSTAGAISSSVVAATGAIVTGFIAQTALKNQDNSSRELIAFFSHPLEAERALAAERLIAQMATDDQKAEAKLVVVKYLAGPMEERRQVQGDSVG